MGRTRNARQRREEIVWGFYECLAHKGHEKVTIKDIAAGAGLPHGVIHYYFGSKDEIVAALAQALVDRTTARLEARLAAADPARRVGLALDFIVDELVFSRPLNRVFFNLIQMAFERAALDRVVTDMFRAYRQRVGQVLREAGLGASAPALGAGLVALAEGFALQWTIDPRACTRQQVHQMLIRLIDRPKR
jgi:AcrR family transcriptional regulator